VEGSAAADAAAAAAAAAAVPSCVGEARELRVCFLRGMFAAGGASVCVPRQPGEQGGKPSPLPPSRGTPFKETPAEEESGDA